MVLQTIHESFDENEMRTLREAKGKQTWRDFILDAAKRKAEKEQKKVE